VRARLGVVAVIFAITMASLATALLAGLWRLGWNVPLGAGHAIDHGALLIFGVFSTVIGLERAVALAAPWAYAAPIATSLTAVAMLSGHRSAAAVLAVTGIVGLTLTNVAVIRRQSSAATGNGPSPRGAMHEPAVTAISQ